MPKIKRMETILKNSEQIDKEIKKLKGQNFDNNYMQTIFNIVLLIILIVEVFLNIYMYITPSHKIREIDLRLLGLEKLIYNIEEEE
jgi:hypothetical protein